MKKNILFYCLLFLVLIIAFYLRILYLDSPLWYDEALSWVSATCSFPYGIMDNLLNVDIQHTPLYFFILHFWIKIFSQSEISMRVLSLIFGVLTIPLVFIVSNKIFTKKIAVLSTAICAFSPLLILFSVEVRMYPMVTFLVLLSINYLIDFEQKENNLSLIKLVITNILIPYTFVGAIFYNFSLLLFYGIYLYKNKKNLLKKYLTFSVLEWLALIPFFILIFSYAKTRMLFVVKHEGILHFSNIVDIIRNFFGTIIDPNVYWPSSGSYSITLLFTILVIIPCIYFVYGYVKSFKCNNNFVKTLCLVFLGCFMLFILLGALKFSVVTVRYILYILPPVIILATAGIINNFKAVNYSIFFGLFFAASLFFSYKNAFNMKHYKMISFKSPAIQCKQIGLDYRDVVIMPFGSDALYYFSDLSQPVVPNFDFHKTVRNPNSYYYDDNQQKIMAGDGKYKLILDRINDNSIFSGNFYNYFMKNVYSNVEKDRYAVLIMYGDDNNFIVPIDKLRKDIDDEDAVKSKTLYSMFSKYMCDIAAMLNLKFNFITSFTKDNFTYYIYQKK